MRNFLIETLNITANAIQVSDFLKKEIGVEDTRICGSIALHLLGIDLNREIHDIDIEVFVDENKSNHEEIQKKLAILEEASDTTYLGFYPERNKKTKHGYKNIYVFNYKGYTVNVFVIEGFAELRRNYVIYNDTKVTTISNIIKKKKEYNREKDIRDINDIISQLLKPNEEE